MPTDPIAKAESWSFVTAYKTGSTYVRDIVATLLGARGITAIDLAGDAWAHNVLEWDYCIQNQHLLETPGRFFGPFRHVYMNEMPALAKTNIVVHVRDPRDCLVSFYYSVAFSHTVPEQAGPPREEMLTLRRQAHELGVDNFVLQYLEEYEQIFQAMIRLLETMPNVYLSRYEDMVLDFEVWLDELANYLDCSHLSDVKQHIISLAKFDVTEDEKRHKRQVTPGDYRRKLTPETQKALTERLSPILDKFGY